MSFRQPDFITFTGLDNQTSIVELFEISRLYPVEWGVLFSPKRSGKDPRYPEIEIGMTFLNSPLVTAAHVCGGHADKIMGRQPVQLFGAARRVQINHPNPDVEAARDWSRSTGYRIILQSRDELGFPAPTHHLEWLFDRSGGGGLQPESWPAYPERQGQRMVGYAGGIGPNNVIATIEAISASGPYWIDMESGVRDENDHFDLAKVRAVCEAVYGIR